MDSPGKARKKQQKSEKRKEFLMLIRQPGLLFAIIFVFAVLILFCIYPIVRLFISCLTDKSGQLNLDNINYVFTKTDFFQAFWNSVKLGLFVGLMATIVGYVYAFAITRTSLPGKKFFNIMAILPILSPPFEPAAYPGQQHLRIHMAFHRADPVAVPLGIPEPEGHAGNPGQLGGKRQPHPGGQPAEGLPHRDPAPVPAGVPELLPDHLRQVPVRLRQSPGAGRQLQRAFRFRLPADCGPV